MGSKNIAYVGKSSPIAYDFEHPINEKVGWGTDPGGEDPVVPNPILESPLALLLLYDEIWFLDRRLCPRNMQDLDYVKFVGVDDVDTYLNEYRQLCRQENFSVADILHEDVSIRNIDTRQNTRWTQIVDTIAPFASPDTHGFLPIGPPNITSVVDWRPSVGIGCFIEDYYIMNQLSVDADYVSNSIVDSQIQFSPVNNWSKATNTVENLLSQRLVNYQSPDGPYFNKIDEFRDYSTLSDFRQRVSNAESDVSVNELNEEFDHIRNEILMSETSRWTVYESILLFASNFIPGVSEVMGPVSAGRDIFQSINRRQHYGWANFLAKVEEEPPTNE